jgi:hypothetical protein
MRQSSPLASSRSSVLIRSRFDLARRSPLRAANEPNECKTSATGSPDVAGVHRVTSSARSSISLTRTPASISSSTPQPPQDVRDRLDKLTQQSVLPLPRAPLLTSTPAYPKGSPMSPRPHLFGDPQSDPSAHPDRVLPSDLLTMEDYRRMRYTATKRSVIGGAAGGIGAALAARFLYPKPLTANALILIGGGERITGRVQAESVGVGIASATYASGSYLKNEIRQVREKADLMSTPKAEDGSYLFGDRAIAKDNTPSLAEPPVVPGPPPVASNIATPDRSRWGVLGEGREEGELRDPFFRPGVPRRDV